MKQYVTGLVVGKFCPLHKGHEKVIEQALDQCEKVIVLSYTSLGLPGYDATTRKRWLENMDISCNRLEVHVLDDICWLSDSDSDHAHRMFCADYLLDTLETTVQAVFTSESYGDGFAEVLTDHFSTNLKTACKVDHVMVDLGREEYPVSGTILRSDLALGLYSLPSRMMSPFVLSSFVRKILFLGGESTGKSTISLALANHFNAKLVPEFGRFHYITRSENLMYEDMAYIGKMQRRLEDRTATLSSVSEYLFCDTSPLTTMFYSKALFGRVAPALSNLVWECDQRYHKIYLCAPDFPMVQDGTRQDEDFRSAGHEFYLDELAGAGETYTILTGTLEEKIAKVIADLS